MRKDTIGPGSAAAPSTSGWLDLDQLARVELTSEDPAYPIEAALTTTAAPSGEWRAAQPGPQTIRLLFDEPRPIRQIRLRFEEHVHGRTQEFVLRWSTDGGATYRDIVRQQYNFSPPSTTREQEDYFPELTGVSALELTILPHIGGGPARATLAELRVR